MYHIKIKNIKRINSYNINSLASSNNYTIDLYTKGDRTIITNFDNCSQPTTNFTYNKNADGTCNGIISLKGGYTYTITLTCDPGWYYPENGGFSRVTSNPNIYIYFSYANADNDATNVGNQTRNCNNVACDANSSDSSCSQQICSETSTFTVKLTSDNQTLHFKIENTQDLKGGGYVEFSGNFSITSVPNT
jgi:hypothetical protein